MKYLFFSISILLSCSSKINNSSQELRNNSLKINKKNTFEFFYENFRKAVLNNDSKLIQEYTNFPLDVWGYEDQDPQIKISQENFTVFFDSSIVAKTEYNSTTDNKCSTKDMIKEIDNVSKLESLNPNRNEPFIGNLVFRKINGEWKLSIVFVNTKNINTN